MNKLTGDIILILVVIGGIISFFYNPGNTDMEFIRILMGSVVGYYIGLKEIPVLRVIKK